MMLKLLVIFLLLKYHTSSCLEDQVSKNTITTDDGQLIFAHVLYRHGDRNIEDGQSHPMDPYKDEKFWPGGYGQLTTLGMQQHYELGQYIRRRYSNLIGTKYSTNKVYIGSTNSDRALASAQCNAAGLFPPSEDEIWNEDLPWQPIPIHTVPSYEDYSIYPDVPCPRADRIMQNYLDSITFKSELDKYKTLFEFIGKHSGKKMSTLYDIMLFYDTILIEKLRGFVFEDWVCEIFEDETIWLRIAALYIELRTYDTELKTLMAGYVIKEMLDRFKSKSLSTLQPFDRSLWIYSSHDKKIMDILNSLNVTCLLMPPYASSLFFELYKSGEEYYVQLFYRPNENEYLSPIDIPNCGTKCPLDKMFEIYRDIFPTESIDKMCQKIDDL